MLRVTLTKLQFELLYLQANSPTQTKAPSMPPPLPRRLLMTPLPRRLLMTLPMLKLPLLLLLLPPPHVPWREVCLLLVFA